MITVLSGGVGAARFLRGLIDVVRHDQVTAIVNVGDDLVLNGLHVSPDLDTVTYTLADAIDPERGWGLDGETWQAMETLGRYGGPSWFSLGDRDLGTHLYRTHRLAEGATLTEVTAEIVRGWGLDLRVLPVTDDPASNDGDALPQGRSTSRPTSSVSSTRFRCPLSASTGSTTPAQDRRSSRPSPTPSG